MAELSTSSTVINLVCCAPGVRDAWRRCVTATSASCSGVVPNSFM
jgi:hypothetical protein